MLQSHRITKPVCIALFINFIFSIALFASDLNLKERIAPGFANGAPQVIPDCANSNLKIAPCHRIARSWIRHLNSRAGAFVAAYRAAGYRDQVRSAVLDCSSGIFNNRKSREGTRNSRHAYGEACDGSYVKVNGVTFSYRRAVTNPGSKDRTFFVSFLDGWGTPGPGCIPDKNYRVLGMKVGCRPVVSDNCGVIDWRERGAAGPYGHTYHLSYCNYGNLERAYE